MTYREKDYWEVVTKNPRNDYGLPFSTWWSLRVLAAGFIAKDMHFVDSISHNTEVGKHSPKKNGVKWRQSKITLGNSLEDPAEYHFNKRESKKN